jgi:hypothetical protein
MKILLTLIALCLAFPLHAQERKESYYFISDIQTGRKIFPGDTVKTLQERFGDPKTITYPKKTEGGYDDFIYIDYESFSAKVKMGGPDQIDGRKILVMYLNEKNVATYRGLKIGDSIDKAKALFKDKKYRLEKDLEGNYLFIDLPFDQGGHDAEDRILCVYDDNGYIVTITVGAIVWD